MGRRNDRARREAVANEARAKAEAAGASLDEMRLAGRRAGQNYEHYEMKSQLARKYEGEMAEHGREIGAGIVAVGAIAGAIYPPVGAIVTAAGTGVIAAGAQQERVRDRRLENREELKMLLEGRRESADTPEETIPEEPPTEAAPKHAPLPLAVQQGVQGVKVQARLLMDKLRMLWASLKPKPRVE